MILPPKPVQVPASGVQTQSVNQDQRITMATVKLAHETLHERTVDDGAKEIATAWKRLHAPPANTSTK